MLEVIILQIPKTVGSLTPNECLIMDEENRKSVKIHEKSLKNTMFFWFCVIFGTRRTSIIYIVLRLYTCGKPAGRLRKIFFRPLYISGHICAIEIEFLLNCVLRVEKWNLPYRNWLTGTRARETRKCVSLSNILDSVKNYIYIRNIQIYNNIPFQDFIKI